MNAPRDFRAMTADSIGKDLLGALLQEIKLMPDVWQKLPQQKQDDVIDRIRARVETNIRMAVHVLASEGRTTVVGELDQVVRKDGIKAVFKINSNAEGRHELFDSERKACLIIIADAGENLAGMDDIHGETDQRALDLGHEYHNNDGGGMDDVQDGNVVDAEFEEVKQLPAPGDATPTEAELDAAFDAGYDAAEAGEPESACPVMAGALCIEWVKGWKAAKEDAAGAELFTDKQPEPEPELERKITQPAVRYRHPTNENQTWTGRGRKPAWVQAWLDAGGTLEELAVDDEPEAA
ncbi:H-NS histone family protein [Chromobacterium subtsugae]|uniref:H-NS histone family protein n=1 Tax=Chromobacterium subtsugae TaxID=251747 RepID=UPI000640BD9A|nr:H-NS histone family protein [Chromobacterium subtsugae]OBU84561.1 cell division protein FtsK [Chromobacterium subtsugae]